jgi:hypothetical protein
MRAAMMDDSVQQKILRRLELELLAAMAPDDARVWQARVAITRGAKTAWLCPAGKNRPRPVKLSTLRSLVVRGLVTLDETGETDLVWRRL